MILSTPPRRHRFPVAVISQAVWIYLRFNNSYRDIEGQLAFRGIMVSPETIRSWSIKFSNHFHDVIKKRERNPSDKWHLDEMAVKINGEFFILWRAVDSEGFELDVLRRNKEAAIRFLSRLLESYPAPRVMVTDKLRSYRKPIQIMCRKTEHRTPKALNNRAENAHQPTRRKEKCLIRFKSPRGGTENAVSDGESS